MRVVFLGFVVAILCFLFCGCTKESSQKKSNAVVLIPFAEGLEAPLYVSAPAADSRVFIVEQPGRIRIVKDGKLLSRPFLDITDRVGYGGERGLLSVAFHPNYASNGFLYVNYTDREHGDTHVERYSAAPGS